jgi:hypothetical protein
MYPIDFGVNKMSGSLDERDIFASLSPIATSAVRNGVDTPKDTVTNCEPTGSIHRDIDA